MALNCGIIGLSSTGKTTIFNCISNTKAEIGFASKSNIGMCEVVDDRLKKIDNISHSKRIVPATVEIVDLPGLSKGGQGVGNKLLAEVQTMDALIHVLRCFDDPNIPHSEGCIDPVRDMELVDLELQVRDLDLVSRKLERVQKLLKNGEKDNKKAFDVLSVYKEVLENMGNARDAKVDPDDRKYIQDLQLLTAKPIIYVCNVAESEAADASGNPHVKAVQEFAAQEHAEVVTISAKVEAEIAELPEEEAKEYLEMEGLTEAGLNRLIKAGFKLLGLQTYLTAGEIESRAWTINIGTKAPQAAGKIHTDFEKGFIKAEIVSYDDLVKCGSKTAAREKGLVRLEGKDYVMQDGDVVEFRFNV